MNVTFSEKKVVEMLKNEFVPVWESVAPVTVATYKLDEDREVRGVVNGEIALFFCRPDGRVFDVLPALQSPAETLVAMQGALELYRATNGARDWAAIKAHHAAKHRELTTVKAAEIARGEAGLEKRNMRIGDATQAPTKDLRVAIASKSAVVAPAERFITVEPGGMDLYKSRVHFKMAQNESPQPPERWTKLIFEEVLEMPLEGHTTIYDTSSVAPFTIIEE